jgi:hypothetical protein
VRIVHGSLKIGGKQPRFIVHFFGNKIRRMCLPASVEYSSVRLQGMAHETRIAAGPPASPLAFPTPTIHRAQISHANLFRGDGQRDGVPTEARVLCRATRSMGENAYLIQSRIARSSHGSVYLCIVLKRRRALDDEWIASKERVAVKCSSFQKMRQDSSASDPLRGTRVAGRL